jgi:hypothetical protein
LKALQNVSFLRQRLLMFGQHIGCPEQHL